MKVEVVVKGYYEMPDDPAERRRIYGTDDISQCLWIDRTNDPDLLLGICHDVSIESSEVA